MGKVTVNQGIFFSVCLSVWTSALAEAQGIQYDHPDHLGSNGIVTDDHGQVTELTTYTPFGEISHEIRDTKYTSRLLYTGQEFDAESSLHYYGARYYDPALSRFISVDPVFDGPSPYSYVGNNPIIRTDPTGKRIEIDTGNEELNSQIRTMLDEFKNGENQDNVLGQFVEELDTSEEVMLIGRRDEGILNKLADTLLPDDTFGNFRSANTLALYLRTLVALKNNDPGRVVGELKDPESQIGIFFNPDRIPDYIEGNTPEGNLRHGLAKSLLVMKSTLNLDDRKIRAVDVVANAQSANALPTLLLISPDDVTNAVTNSSETDKSEFDGNDLGTEFLNDASSNLPPLISWLTGQLP